jgi:hypothetical protein
MEKERARILQECQAKGIEPKLDKDGNIEVGEEKQALFRTIAANRAEEFAKHNNLTYNPGKEIVNTSEKIVDLTNQIPPIQKEISGCRMEMSRCGNEMSDCGKKMLQCETKINQALDAFGHSPKQDGNIPSNDDTHNNSRRFGK